MKNRILWSLIAVLQLATTLVSAQVKEMPANLPDANLPSSAWRNDANGKLAPFAPAAAATLMNLSGEAVNAIPEMGSQSMADAAKGEIVTVTGRVSGLSPDGKISFSGKEQTVSAHRWFRWNSEWVLYIRTGCWNPVLVYEPEKELTPKDLTVTPPPAPQLFLAVILIPVEKDCPPPPPVVPTPCCKLDSLDFMGEPYVVVQADALGSEIVLEAGAGYEWHAYSSHRDCCTDDFVTNNTSPYGGINVLVSKQEEAISITCDTCGYWGDEVSPFGIRSQIYLGFEWKLSKKLPVHGFGEVRYDWFNSNNQFRKFLSPEHIVLGVGLKGGLNLPTDFPIFRRLEVTIAGQAGTIGDLNGHLRIGAGGNLGIRLTLGKKGS